MSIAFNAVDHSYNNINKEDTIKWVSVTTLISHFKEPFNAKETANIVSKNKKSKWFGITPSDILDIWDKESKRASTLGTFYHNQREDDLCNLSSLEKDGFTIPIFNPVAVNTEGLKIAPIQKLEIGIYPEHMVYLKSAGICGQSDLVEIVNGVVNIIDYKTNKKISRESYKNWEGKSKKLYSPLSHLDDCEFNHYALQLSMYMYIILKHNHKLKPGKMSIHHVTFYKEAEDQWGYPITKMDMDNNPIVEKVEIIDIPYLYNEIMSIIHYTKENKELILKNKK